MSAYCHQPAGQRVLQSPRPRSTARASPHPEAGAMPKRFPRERPDDALTAVRWRGLWPGRGVIVATGRRTACVTMLAAWACFCWADRLLHAGAGAKPGAIMTGRSAPRWAWSRRSSPQPSADLDCRFEPVLAHPLAAGLVPRHECRLDPRLSIQNSVRPLCGFAHRSVAANYGIISYQLRPGGEEDPETLCAHASFVRGTPRSARSQRAPILGARAQAWLARLKPRARPRPRP